MGKGWYFIIGIFIILVALLGYFIYDIYFKSVPETEDKIGANSNQNTPPTSNSNIICDSDTYNCDDFTSCEDVMEVFNECDSDIHKLDNDGDGVPCEALCS